jgi:hypothetical protein
MAISTLDGLVAGFQLPRSYHKTGITMSAVGAMRGYSPFYAAGGPGAGTAPSSGVNGAAETGPLAGCIGRSNPVSGNAYLSRWTHCSSTSGVVWLIDRLWSNSGLSTTLTTSQSITSAALPARDINGSTNGEGVFAALEWSATGGAGTPTVTLGYTNSDNTSGRSATLTAVTTPPVGTWEIFALAAGDKGIRSVQSLTQSATRTSGTYHLILFRVIAQLEVSNTGFGDTLNPITGGLPRIYDNTCYSTVLFPIGTGAANQFGTITEAHG